MNCPSCSKVLEPIARFCSHCGAKLSETEDTVVRQSDAAVDKELDRVRNALAAKYEITERLGQGGMGVVFAAFDPSLDREIAIKVMPEKQAEDDALVERFRREARVAARLRHPRIISIHEVGEIDGVHYFTMDHIDGQTLRGLVRQKTSLSGSDALAIVGEVAAAVGHAHAHGVIHRDLKPENVMIDNDGEVFVLDFGLARSVDDPSITQSGAVMGSPLYMSPEQLGGESLDARSDVFSLGLILYYCLTGEELFRADSISGIIAKQLSVRVPDVVGDDARVPASLKTLLLAMLEKKREDRPSDLGALIAEARRIVHGGDDETDESGRATLKLETGPAMKEVPTGDREDDGAARRRKRLKSLLDDL